MPSLKCLLQQQVEPSFRQKSDTGPNLGSLRARLLLQRTRRMCRPQLCKRGLQSAAGPGLAVLSDVAVTVALWNSGQVLQQSVSCTHTSLSTLPL